MEQGHLLDTNIVVYLLYGKLSPRASQKIKKALQKKAKLSVISKIELLSWEKDVEKYADFINSSHVLMLDDDVIQKCIEIRKKYKTSLPGCDHCGNSDCQKTNIAKQKLVRLQKNKRVGLD